MSKKLFVILEESFSLDPFNEVHGAFDDLQSAEKEVDRLGNKDTYPIKEVEYHRTPTPLTDVIAKLIEAGVSEERMAQVLGYLLNPPVMKDPLPDASRGQQVGEFMYPAYGEMDVEAEMLRVQNETIDFFTRKS